MEHVQWIGETGLSGLRLSLPLVLAAWAGLVSERSGVINIALEGLLLIGAFAAAASATIFHPGLASIVAALSGITLMMIYGLFVLRWESDQVVAGTAINLLAAALPPVLGKVFFQTTGSTPALELHQRLHFAPWIWALLAGVGVTYLYHRSVFGLRLRFAGEKPEALEAAGVSVLRVRWGALVLAGALGGLGGATLSLFFASSFSRDMSAGRGFMALAALIVGRWKPLPALAGCLLFGFTDAIQMRLQGSESLGWIPLQLVQSFPYILTLLLISGLVGRSLAPAALGRKWNAPS